MKNILKYISLAVFLIQNMSSYGQNYTMTVVSLGKDEAFINNRVINALEDSDGFIWMVAQNGIGRYDGHNYKWFNKINSQLRDISYRRLAEDGEGYIWVNYGTNVDLLHHKTFEVISFEEKFKDILDHSKVSNVRPGPNNSVFFRVLSKKEQKAYIYDSKTGLKELPFVKENTTEVAIRGEAIWLEYNRLWEQYDLNTGTKLNELNITNRFSHVKLVDGITTEQNLFLGLRDNQVIAFQVNNNEIKELISFPKEDPNRNIINLAAYDAKSQLLLTLSEQKLIAIDLKNNELTPINISSREGISVPFTKLFMTDKKGTIWGANKGEINLAKINPIKFTKYQPNKSARGLWANEDFIFTTRSKTSLTSPNTYTNIKAKTIISTETNIKDELWIGSGLGVSNYFPQNSSQSPILYAKNQTKKAPKPWAILRDKEQTWWTSDILNLGLFRSKMPSKDSLYRFSAFNEFKELENSKVIHLLEDGEHIWASSDYGLYLIHKEKGVIQRYAADIKAPYQLPFNNIYFLHKDKNNVYWAATNADGLVRFEIDGQNQVKNYTVYSTEEGLSSNILYAIIEDDTERLWISTLNGLSCFDKKTNEIQAFFNEDGLAYSEFNRISYAQDKDGRIFFGTIKGVIGFNPDDFIKKSAYQVSISITKFEKYQLQNKKLTDETHQLLKNKKITLHPSDRLFRLSVSMKDYFNTKRIRYSYKIKGLYEDFQLMDGNTIEIGGLPYGKYTLVIRGQGADRRYSTEELNIPLVVVRPFYLQWWAILLAITLIAVSAFQVYLWRIKLLEERKRELEILVLERTQQIRADKAIIEAQAQQLSELDEVKSKFFANISHELRTPLTLILGPLNNLFQVNQLSNKQYTQLQLMLQNGKKLLKRINELLDLSKLDANKLQVFEHPTFLYPFFKTLLSTFESTANLKNVQLQFDYRLNENIQVLLDDDKVEKIIANYLSNALKFTPKGGKIILSVSKKENNLHISIQDTGIGILPEELNRVFDRFYQSNNKDVSMQHLNGTGIGLSLCHELAKVLKGRVWATSEINKGSIFYLELALIETFAVKKQAEEEVEEEILPLQEKTTPTTTNLLPQHLSRPTILIVEDNPDLRTYLTLILEDDYEIILAENGQKALDELEIRSSSHKARPNNYELGIKSKSGVIHNSKFVIPNLIISDIMMPVMDGIEFLNKIKSSKEWCHLPMIMLTARQSLDVKIEALRIGVDDYLTKPFVDNELKARVANLIENSQNRLATDILTQKKTVVNISAADLKWIQQVEEAILENIENFNFKINDLGPVLALSYSQIQRKIKQITGLSPKQYERSIKLAKARDIIKSGNVQTVSEVAFQLGFNNHYYFSKIYKQMYGIMPTEELKNA